MRTNALPVAMFATLALVFSACTGAQPTQQPPTATPTMGPTASPTTAPTGSPTTAPTASPTTAPTGSPAADFLACMVSDTGGIDDRSFNQNGWEGMQMAEQDFGIEVRFLESTTAEDYARNINQHIADGCDIIVTVGFLLGDDTSTAAIANPDQRFAIVDFAYDPALPNVEGLVYNTGQAAMLAGYASASWSKTKVMGTFGGINIGGPVTDFMDGFIAGTNYWNAQKNDTVTVLGGRNPLDPASGTFTGNFDSTDDARAFTIGMLDEGADVILPVGGPIGLGTFAAIRERNAEAVGLGVDVDWTRTASEFADLMLTHILKRIDVSVYQAIERAIEGTTPAPVFVSDLANGGVGLGEFHDYDAEISAETKTEIEALAQAIIAGDIVVSDYYAAP